MSKAVDRRLRRIERSTLLAASPLGALRPEERTYLDAYLLSSHPNATVRAPEDAHLSRASKKRIARALDSWMEQSMAEFGELERRGELPAYCFVDPFADAID